MQLLARLLATEPPLVILLYGLVLGVALGEAIRLAADIARYVYRRLTNRCVCCGTPLFTGEIDHEPVGWP